MQLQIVAFGSEHVAAAGELLARQYAEAVAAEPLLPPRFTEPDAAAREVAAALSRKGASGVAALRDGQLVGFLIGEAKDDVTFGRHVWVHPAGAALAETELASTLEDLYAVIGQRWVERGHFTHFIMASVYNPRLMEAWQALNFAREQIFAVRPIAPQEAAAPTIADPALTVRRATPADVDQLVELATLHTRAQWEAPCWTAVMPEKFADERVAVEEDINDPAVMYLVAERAGRLVSHAVFVPLAVEVKPLMMPEHGVVLGIAGTVPEERGRGATRAIFDQALAQAFSQGYRALYTDWRSANFPAARVWPKLGFRPIVYRMVRRIDPRTVFAKE